MIPSEIPKTHINTRGEISKPIFNRAILGNRHGWWQKGIMIFLRKRNKKLPNSYRPIAVLPSIYKIWGAIVSNRVNPIINLLTNGHQCACKQHKSNIDIIYEIKHRFIKKTMRAELLLGVGKDFCEIQRNLIWWILYKGVPS